MFEIQNWVSFNSDRNYQELWPVLSENEKRGILSIYLFKTRAPDVREHLLSKSADDFCKFFADKYWMDEETVRFLHRELALLLLSLSSSTERAHA